MGCDGGHYTTCTFNHRSRPLPWQCAVPHAGMPHSAPAYTPHVNLNGEKPKPWAVPRPVTVCRYRARDLWAVPGPGPGATQTTWCERRSRRCPLQAGQGDSDGPPCCRRRHLSAAAAWQCGRRDAAVAATVSPGSAPPILRRGRTTHAGNDVCVGTGTVKDDELYTKSRAT